MDDDDDEAQRGLQGPVGLQAPLGLEAQRGPQASLMMMMMMLMLMMMMVMNKMTPGKRLARGPRVVDHVDGNGGG